MKEDESAYFVSILRPVLYAYLHIYSMYILSLLYSMV